MIRLPPGSTRTTTPVPYTTLFRAGREPFSLPPNDPTLYFLQRRRDEAHRFAIGTHRARRTKAIGRWTLDEIAGIGAARKRALLNHFGSAKGVSRAGLSDLETVPGINSSVAKKVYDHFHPQGYAAPFPTRGPRSEANTS